VVITVVDRSDRPATLQIMPLDDFIRGTTLTATTQTLRTTTDTFRSHIRKHSNVATSSDRAACVLQA
jgi:hypothetical protein